MNPRTIRRAIERKAQKQAHQEAVKALAAAPGSSVGYIEQIDFTPQPPPISDSRLQANRENAALSTGPKTPAGKSVSSRNAIKTALTGRTVLLPTDDADRYESHLAAFSHELKPEGQLETLLTQSLADIAWRIERIAGFEMAIYAKGRALLANTHQEDPAAIRAQLIELDVFQSNERELRNLHLYEARLRRQRDRDHAELLRLQAERRRVVQENLELAAQAYTAAKIAGQPFDPATLGFVFSTTEIEHFLCLRNRAKAA